MGCNKMALKRRFCKGLFSSGFRSKATHRQLLIKAAFWRFLFVCYTPFCYAPFCGMASMDNRGQVP